jgi:hypothetical protein
VSDGKVCSRCDEWRPVSSFHRNRRRADNMSVWCKSCQSAYGKQWNQRPEVKKRNAARALARYHRLSTDEKLRIQARRYHMGRHLITKYGLTMEDYGAILEAQGKACAICKRPPKEGRRLAVDHDHACCPGEVSCGKCVRGLLCTTCNVWLGFYENKEWIALADRYLDREIAKRERDGR